MTTCHDIQLWWELPSIAHFCSLFRAAFDLLDFDIEDLEESILTDGLDGSGSPLLVELLVRLLQGCMPGRSVTPSNVDSCLRKLFRQKCQENSHQNLLPEGDFRSVSLRRKVEILHALCDLRLEAEDVLDLLKNLETESLRVEPLGYDDNGATYWYFYGTRLYREDHSFYHPYRKKPKERQEKKKRKKLKYSEDTDDEESLPVWQVECFTEDDWTNLAKRFESCESRLERSLLQTLQDDFLPEIPRLFEEKEKRRIMEFTSRRSSGRVQKLKEKRREEEMRQAVEVDGHKKKRITTGSRRRLEDEVKAEQEVETLFEKDNSFEELLPSPSDEPKKSPLQSKDRKKRKSRSHQEIRRKSDREEDILQERNLSPHPVAERAHNHKPYKRKEPKNHIRNHSHSKKGHRRKSDPSAAFVQEEMQPVSDASNKENAGDNFSGTEDCVDFPEASDKPKVFTGRKTNNSLSSLAFSLTPSTVVPEAASHIVNPSIPTKRRVKTAHMMMQSEDELRTGMYKILEHLGDHEDAWPFLETVDETFAPNYYAVIRRPMYISKMEQRLDSGFYASLSMFDTDFKLMMDNCKLYNGPDSEYTHMAYNLEKVFSKLKEKHLEADFSSDDEIYIDMSFEQVAKKKRKSPPTEEKETRDDETEKKKRGRKKKKAGRKPKIAPPEPEDTGNASGSARRKDKRSKTRVPSPISEEVELDDGRLSAASYHSNADEDFDINRPVLLVREDPYARDEPSDDGMYGYPGEVKVDADSGPESFGGSGKPRGNTRRKSVTKVEERNGFMLDEEKVAYFAEKINKGKKRRRKSSTHRKSSSDQPSLEISPDPIVSPPRERSPFDSDPFTNPKPSDSDIDSDQEAVLLYYNNDPESDRESENRAPILVGLHPDSETCETPVKKRASKTPSTSSSKKDKKKHRSPVKEHHRHKHQHHHRSRGSKHHKRKPAKRSGSGSESPVRKPQRLDESYDYSEGDVLDPPEREPSEDELPKRQPSPLAPPKVDRSSSPSKKKKDRRRHHKSTKRKDDKVVKPAKANVKPVKTSRHKKKVSPKKMAAIDALSSATEQTLKDITTLLNDPTVPRFNEDDLAISGAPEITPAKEYNSIAAKIEEDYRQKLQLDATDEKKSRKRKRKKDDPSKTPTRKKPKKEPKVEPAVDLKTDPMSLDSKELFKDLKDGRIKPGAIIKSKDIAKKEGQVKKDNTKAAVEGKPKPKANPFGKINKQENTKLTTLIAKAKESRVGLMPNSEMGDSPKLSLGSILQFGDIGSSKHSSREPDSPEEEEKPEKQFDSPYDSRWENADTVAKDEFSNHSLEDGLPEQQQEQLKIEEQEDICEESPIESSSSGITPPDEALSQLPTTPQSATPTTEFLQEKVTPNLSAWFRAFGGPKVSGSPRKKPSGGKLDDDDYPDDDVDDVTVCDDDDDDNEPIDVCGNPKPDSPASGPAEGGPPPAARSPIRNSSPQPPLSPVKPPETPWFQKADDKTEDEPIWKKNKTQEDEDPYKFEEEELDRAREEAKKLEVERQRKASVSSSCLSDPSPLNIDSDRSPAAFSSEGERSPITCSPSTRSPVTPGFGAVVTQFSPVTEKSPGVTAYSPRYDAAMPKGFAGQQQTNGPLKVGFYQDLSDKSSQEKDSVGQALDIKLKESPIYSPTVPYVAPFYPTAKEQGGISKQKSPARFGSFYSSVDAALDKPKTPSYYPASAPSTPSDKPSPISAQNCPEDKLKGQYNYYNYDPTKSVTDQYKSTGGSATKPYHVSGDVITDKSPGSGASYTTMGSPATPLGLSVVVNKPAPVAQSEKQPDSQPPKKRGASGQKSAHHTPETLPRYDREERRNAPHKGADAASDLLRGDARTESVAPLAGNLANLSQVVSRIPQPGHKSSMQAASSDAQRVPTSYLHQSHHKTVHHPPPTPYAVGILPDIQHAAAAGSRTNVASSRYPEPDHNAQFASHQQLISPVVQLSPHLMGGGKDPPTQPPAAHQKVSDTDRPSSRNMLHHPSDKPPLSYLHQKTMWTSSLPSSIANTLSSIPSSLSSLVSNATMASFALAGQKGFGSLSQDHFAQLGVDRAALASFAGRSVPNSGLFSHHDILQRSQQASGSTAVLGGGGGSVGGSSDSGSGGGGGHRSSGASSASSSGSAGGSSAAAAATPTNNFDLGLARSYANIMGASQASPLLRTDNALARSLSGASSPFLPQSPGLGAALGMSSSSRTPTPAHQQALNQATFPAAISRDPRDPISQCHPSLQIPSLNSIGAGQPQGLNHLNAGNLAYSGRDSLSLMNQGGRGPLGGLADPASQHLYTQYIQRQQQQLAAQEELILRSAGAHGQLAAHQSMMFQQGLMSAAGYPAGYPHSLGLRSGSYQGMNRPWI